MHRIFFCSLLSLPATVVAETTPALMWRLLNGSGLGVGSHGVQRYTGALLLRTTVIYG